MKQQNFAAFGYSFLANGFCKKQIALANGISYAYRVRAKNGIKMKDLATKAGYDAGTMARAISTLASKMNQNIDYDASDRNFDNDLKFRNVNEVFVKVPTYIVQSRLLQSSDIAILGYIKSLGGTWSDSAYKLFQKYNQWITGKELGEGLTFSYITVLKALKTLAKYNLIKVSFEKRRIGAYGLIYNIYSSIVVIDTSVGLSLDDLLTMDLEPEEQESIISNSFPNNKYN